MKLLDLPVDSVARFKYNYPDIYDGTKYNHNISSVRAYNKRNYTYNHNQYFLDLYQLHYCIDYEHVAYCLYDYYCDLNSVINRAIYHGVVDKFYHYFSHKNHIHFLQDRMNKLTALYDDLFLDCFNSYMNSYHTKYSETMGSYKDYFDKLFSSILHNSIYNHISRLRIKKEDRYTYENRRKEKVYINDYLTQSDVIDFTLYTEMTEYYPDLKEELFCRGYSRLQLSTD